MAVRTSVSRRRGKTGKAKGWVARVHFNDPVTGKLKEESRRVLTKSEARIVSREMAEEVARRLALGLALDRKTFADLAHYYREKEAIPPVIVGEHKVSGLKWWKDVRQIIDAALLPSLSERELAAITYGDLRRFREERITTPTARGKQRSMARVNREMSVLRRMFRVALRERWLAADPFTMGESLIQPKFEIQRDRIVTRDEERRLLDACADPRHQHIRPILICLLDTGMRTGEALTLEWRDVDLAARRITVPVRRSKSGKARRVGITNRLLLELLTLRKTATDTTAARVFGLTGRRPEIKNAFATIRRHAGLPDVRLHDLRHTAATRLAASGLNTAEIGRLLGHSQAQTTMRYVNLTDDLIDRAAVALGESKTTPDLKRRRFNRLQRFRRVIGGSKVDRSFRPAYSSLHSRTEAAPSVSAR